MHTRRFQVILAFAIGLAAVSVAAPLIRLAGAPSLVVATWRLGIASFILAPFFWFTFSRRRSELGRTAILISLLSGVFLCFHFAFWIESLHHTTVMSSVVLVTMNPIFLGIASPLLLRERVTRRMLFAIALGITGVVVISLRDFRTLAGNRDILYGNLLALAGAVMNSAYLLCGRRVRRSLSIVSYTYLTYTTAAVLLMLGALVFRQPLLGWPQKTYLCVFLLALFPQVFGHSSFNWALKHVSAPVIGTVILGEPIGASLLAWLVLHETPAPLEVVGGILVLAAIALAALEIGAETEPTQPAASRVQ
jgi:drug/metabolite transporter (DMT)-like permease